MHKQLVCNGYFFEYSFQVHQNYFILYEKEHVGTLENKLKKYGTLYVGNCFIHI